MAGLLTGLECSALWVESVPIAYAETDRRVCLPKPGHPMLQMALANAFSRPVSQPPYHSSDAYRGTKGRVLTELRKLGRGGCCTVTFTSHFPLPPVSSPLVTILPESSAPDFAQPLRSPSANPRVAELRIPHRNQSRRRGRSSFKRSVAYTGAPAHLPDVNHGLASVGTDHSAGVGVWEAGGKVWFRSCRGCRESIPPRGEPWDSVAFLRLGSGVLGLCYRLGRFERGLEPWDGLTERPSERPVSSVDGALRSVPGFRPSSADRWSNVSGSLSARAWKTFGSPSTAVF